MESLWQEVRGLDERYDRTPSISLLADTGQALGQIGFLARNGGDGALQHDLFAAEAMAATLMSVDRACRFLGQATGPTH